MSNKFWESSPECDTLQREDRNSAMSPGYLRCPGSSAWNRDLFYAVPSGWIPHKNSDKPLLLFPEWLFFKEQMHFNREHKQLWLWRIVSRVSFMELLSVSDCKYERYRMKINGEKCLKRWQYKQFLDWRGRCKIITFSLGRCAADWDWQI